MPTEAQKAHTRAVIAARRSAPSRVIRTRNSSGQLIKKRVTSKVASPEEVEATKASELQAVADANTFAEKTRVATEIVEQRKARQQVIDIANKRANIIASGGREEIIKSTDVKTGQELEIRRVVGASEKVVDVKDVASNTTRTTSYGVPKGGGSSRMTGGYIKQEAVTPPSSITAKLPGGELPQFNNFVLTGNGMSSQNIFGTRTDIGENGKIPPITILQPGTIFRTQTDAVQHKGYTIPVFEYHTMGEIQSRPATEEEVTQLQDVIKAEEYSRIALQPTPSIISRTYQEQIGRYKEWASEPFIDTEWIKTQSAKGGKTGEFVGGAVVGAIGTKGDLARTVLISVATAGVGFGVTAVSKGITTGSGSLATAIWGAKVGATTSRIAGITVQSAKIGAGAYFGGKYIYSTATRISQAETSFEKGKITGRATADVAASIYGFKTGTKLYDVTEGWIRTRGMPDYTKIATDVMVETGQRRFVQISKADFNKLTQSQRASLYKNIFGKETADIQKALGVGKGGIHSAGQVGDYSELSRALHIAPRASTNFLDISGGSSGKFNPSIYLKNLFNPPSSPRVVWFETPKGLKYVPGKELSRGVYSWSGKLWSGLKAYIPGSKPEIEAVFDPSVTSGFKSVPFKPGYIVTHGIRVPFTGAYTPVLGSGGSTIPSGDISSYGSISYTAPSLYTQASGISFAYTPSTSSSTPTTTSINNITPSYSSVSSFIPSYSIISSRVSSSRGGSSKSYSSIKSSVAPSVSKAYSSIVGSSKSSKVSPSVSSLYSGLSGVGSSSRGGSSYMSSYKKQPTAFGFKIKPAKLAKSYKKFNVLGRRFGKFKVIGTAKTEREAFQLGKSWSSKTLGVTFKVPKAKWRKLPGYKTKTTKKGNILYIEPEKRRLKKRGRSKEISEIQFYKAIKKGKKK